MLLNPKPGQYVRVWYGRKYAHLMPLHGRTGTVVIISAGRPRNHGILVDNRLYIVPCGNLELGGTHGYQ